MQLFLIAVIGVVLFILITWHEVRRLRILADAERQRTERENALWKMREARDKIDVSLLQRMENAVGALRSLIEEQKRYTWEAAKKAAAPAPAAGQPQRDAMFDAAGIYHEHQGGPRAGSQFPWGTKAIDPRAVGAGLRSDRLLSEIETAAGQQRIFQQQMFADAMLMGVGASRTHYDSGTVRTEHVPAAAFMGGAGGSFDGGGASGDYDRSASPASTSTASDSCSSSSSYSAPSSSDSGSSSCSSSDSGGGSSSSSD